MSASKVTRASGLGFAALAMAAAFAVGQPSAAQDAAPAVAKPAADDAAAKVDKGRTLFANYGCGSCHSLGDAGATGHVGPSFDGDQNLTVPFVVDRVSHGQGAMPAFAGQLSPEEIDDLATYVTSVAGR